MKRINQLLGLIAVLALVWGCGGGGLSDVGSGAQGRAVISITWPDLGRIIPDGADRIDVTVTSVAVNTGNGLPVYDNTIQVNRPTPGTPATENVTFNNLPVGRYRATAEAFSTADAGANPVAVAGVVADFDITSGNTTNFEIELLSTIDSVEIVGGGVAVAAGETRTLTFNARNSGGSLVMVRDTSVRWRSLSPNIQFVESGVLVGSTTTGLTATALMLDPTAGGDIEVSLKPDRESNEHFETTTTLTVTSNSFGALGAPSASLGTQTLSGSPVNRALDLITAAGGGFSGAVAMYPDSSATVYIASARADVNGGPPPDFLYTNRSLGPLATPDTTPDDLRTAFSLAFRGDGDAYVVDQDKAISGGNVVNSASLIKRFNEAAGNFTSAATSGAFEGPIALIEVSGTEELYGVHQPTGEVRRFNTTNLNTASTWDASALLSGYTANTIWMAVANDRMAYFGGQATSGSTSSVVAGDLAGSSPLAAVSFLVQPTVSGEITAIAATDDFLFTLSFVNSVHTLTAFRRSTGVKVAELILPAQFVPYRIAANDSLSVQVFGADVSGGSYDFRVRSTTFN